MNAEYLLEAIGRLDDDLVQEAERCRRPKGRYGWLLGLAASFTVVILLGYGATHFGMGGGASSFSGGGNSGAPVSGNSAPSGGGVFPDGYSDVDSPSAAKDGACAPFEPESPANAAPSSGENLYGDSQGAGILPGTVLVRGGTYILTSEVLAELPGGGEPVLLGTLSALYPDSPSPYTSVEEYMGLNLWAENGETDLLYAVYVELPEGGFARAELVEP